MDNFGPPEKMQKLSFRPSIDTRKVFFMIISLQETKKSAICLKAFEVLEAIT